MERTRVSFSDYDEGFDWVVTYHLGYPEFDDDMSGSDTIEIVVTAPDFDMAARYAQQYLRKKQLDAESRDSWSEAQILSVELI